MVNGSSGSQQPSGMGVGRATLHGRGIMDSSAAARRRSSRSSWSPSARRRVLATTGAMADGLTAVALLQWTSIPTAVGWEEPQTWTLMGIGSLEYPPHQTHLACSMVSY